MFNGKKGFVTMWEDFFKGILIGFIIGAVVIFLGAKNIIPIPFL